MLTDDELVCVRGVAEWQREMNGATIIFYLLINNYFYNFFSMTISNINISILLDVSTLKPVRLVTQQLSLPNFIPALQW